MKKAIFLTIISGAFFALAGASLAEIPPVNVPLVAPLKQVAIPIVKPKVELNQEVLDAFKAAQAAKCAKIQEKIAAKGAGFDENKDRHYNAYKNLRDRMEKLVAKLTAKGYDVTDLKADLSVLDTKIQKFATDYAAYNAKLGETKEYACGHTTGEFKAQLAEARTLLKTVREDSKDIKNYYLNTIKPDLKEIRKQKVEKIETE